MRVTVVARSVGIGGIRLPRQGVYLALDPKPGVVREARRRAAAAGSRRWMRASWASAAQQMMTMRPRSTPWASLRIKPVTVIRRLFNEPVAVLGLSHQPPPGSDTSGARPGGSGGNARFRTSLDTAVTEPGRPLGPQRRRGDDDQHHDGHDEQPHDAARGGECPSSGCPSLRRGPPRRMSPMIAHQREPTSSTAVAPATATVAGLT